MIVYSGIFTFSVYSQISIHVPLPEFLMPNVPLPFLADHSQSSQAVDGSQKSVFSSEVTSPYILNGWPGALSSLSIKGSPDCSPLPSPWLTCMYPADIRVYQLWALPSFSWLSRTLGTPWSSRGKDSARTAGDMGILTPTQAEYLYLLVLLRLDLGCTISISQYTAFGPVQFFHLEDKTKHSSQRAFGVHGKVLISTKA